MHAQETANALSLSSNRATYWQQHADAVSWYKKPSAILKEFTQKLPSGNSHPSWQWFPDGELNTCYNCVDRWVEAGNGEEVAIYWHSEVAQRREVFTYKRLKEEVETLAGVLKGYGVEKGDTVVIYSTSLIPLTTPLHPWWEAGRV